MAQMDCVYEKRRVKYSTWTVEKAATRAVCTTSTYYFYSFTLFLFFLCLPPLHCCTADHVYVRGGGKQNINKKLKKKKFMPVFDKQQLGQQL